MTNTATEFRLTDLIATVIDHNDSIDPDVLADVVVAAVPTDHLRDALRQSVRSMVTDRQRYDATHPGHVMRRQGKTPQNKSAKVTMRRQENWTRLCRGVANVDGVRKRLADLTATDLRVMAALRGSIAAANLAWEVRFNRVADRLTEADVDTLGDLPVAYRDATYADLTVEDGHEFDLT